MIVKRTKTRRIIVAVHGISTRKERSGLGDERSKAKITLRREAEAGSAEADREEN